MSTTRVLRRSWQIVWQYRALWVLGMALALFAGNTIYMGSRPEQRPPQPNNVYVILPNHQTVGVPGQGLRIDLSAPGGARLTLPDGTDEQIDPLLADLVRQVRVSDLLAVGIEIVVLLLLWALCGAVARYVAETAVIRAVDEAETTGRQPTLREALRLGWSARALRLFLIDLVVVLIIVASVATVLTPFVGWAMTMSLLGPGGIVVGAFGVLPLLGITGFAFMCLALLVSLVMQPTRRACALGGLGVFASIRAGIAMLRRNLRDVGITWAIWIAIRVLWAPLGLIVALVLAPAVLAALLAGLAAGGVVTALVAASSAPLVHGITPWILGGLVGLPVFVLVTILPLLLVSGWVELYKSNLWTLTYRELRGTESTLEAAQPNRPLNPAQGVAD